MSCSSLFREFLRYASLSVLGMLALSCYILADTYFIAQQLGPDGLTALNLAIPVFNLLNGIALMLAMGGGARFMLARSAGNPRQGSEVFTHTVVLAALFSALLMLTGGLFSGSVTRLLGADASTYAMTRTYLRTLLLCTPLFLYNSLLQSFVRNDGAPQLAMAAMITGSLSNILLDILFLYTFRMGMFGAVLATCMAPGISMLVLMPYFLRGRHSFRLCRTHFPDARSLRIMAVGASSLIAEVAGGAVIVTFNLLMLRFAGNTGVAAYGVIANLSLVVIAVFTGIAQGAQPLLSRCWGQERLHDFTRLHRYMTLSILLLFALLELLLFPAAGTIVSCFDTTGDPALHELAVQGMHLYFLGAGFAGLNIAGAVQAAAAEQPGRSTLISSLRGFVLMLPLAHIMAFLWGIPGLWLSFPAAEALTLLISLTMGRMCKNPARFQKNL